ncbi:MAG: hypothetical protein IJY27_02150 [Clostridia bacterium]|nr:hypothetical protein [Clostridia bacterium]
MSRSKPINVVCAALFAGIILTFTFYFGIAALTGNDTVSENSVADEMTFNAFSDAFYENEQLLELTDNIEYLLFRSIGSSDIILGDNGFLFDAGETDGGYNYLRDYIGDSRFSESELTAFANILSLRRLAYKNLGVDYLMVVIPNSQTVYSELMPYYMGELSENTRLSQLSDYLEGEGYDYFYDTTDLMLTAKTYGKLLYNNTENSLNSLGEWYLYDGVREKLEQMYGINGSLVGVSSLDLYTRSTDGKELARRAGLESIILNETVSLSNSAQTKYTVSSYYGTMVRTSVTEEYTTESDDVVLLEFTNDWDRILLMPYFSNTYSEVTYKNNHQFSGLTMDNLQPSVVVQFIHEYELYDLLDSNTLLTYNAGLELSIDDTITSPPLLISQCSIDSHTVCIAGETESDALMTVRVDGQIIKTERAIGELFFISVDLGDKRAVNVSITAQADDKLVSEPIELVLRSDPDAKDKTVAVGHNSELYSADYSWLSFLSDDQILAVREGLEQKISRVKELTGRDTEYLYLIVPDKLAVYSDDAPEALRKLLPTINQYRDIVRGVRESAGMSVIDLTAEMRTHTIMERLYSQTDMLWTGFGAYVGYHSLMTEISEKFSSVNVHELVDFMAVSEYNVGGELVTRLGLDGAVIVEEYLTLQRLYQPQARFEHSGDGAFDITQAFISYVDDPTLPVAIVTRDAYGTEMLDNMAEHFSKMIVLREDEFTISDELISEIKPDFIITIRCNGELS